MALTKITGEGVGAVDSLHISGNASNASALSDTVTDFALRFESATTTNYFSNAICFAEGTNVNASIASFDSGSGGTQGLVFGTGASNTERMLIDGNGVFKVPYVYSDTNGSAANVHIGSDGRFYRSTSSRRYKNTIADATHGLTELLALRPVTYKGNNNGDLVFGGLIAEEVHDAGLTEFVEYNDDNEPDALAYANMVSLCIKAIQEQQATITALEARITALETE